MRAAVMAADRLQGLGLHFSNTLINYFGFLEQVAKLWSTFYPWIHLGCVGQLSGMSSVLRVFQPSTGTPWQAWELQVKFKV